MYVQLVAALGRPVQDRKRAGSGKMHMRCILVFALIAASSLAITRPARAQPAVSAGEAATCFGFSFGAWTPPLDWHASGLERTPDSIATPLASAGRGWATELTHPDQDGTMLLFPSWWPVGVKVALHARALAPGDTVDGLAIALVGNGFVTPSRAAVRAWLVPCGAPRGKSAGLAGSVGTSALIGIWRGTSVCLTHHGQCGRDSVAYRIDPIVGAPDSVSLAASTIAAAGERSSGQLRCRYDVTRAILSCDAPAGVLRLAVRGSELGGRLTRHDGVDLRYVYVRRARR
jgi:hypothetical protein